MNCRLEDYAARAMGRAAPLASDRCTVFMERDVNHYLKEGYSVDEVLTSILHSICENYLTKVAVENSIGQFIVFQGATAKNRALVAAFEQRLRRPIHVSRYCHLTGAMGAALVLQEQQPDASTFRGLDLHGREIPVRSETCELCHNHCKLTVADLGSEVTAFGFLCGREYRDPKQVVANLSGYDFLKARKRAWSPPGRKDPPTWTGPTIGLPAALYMVEDLPFWKCFFHELGLPTVTSEKRPTRWPLAGPWPEPSSALP